MSLDVTLGYPMMVCSQVFCVYRHVMCTVYETLPQCSGGEIHRGLELPIESLNLEG